MERTKTEFIESENEVYEIVWGIWNQRCLAYDCFQETARDLGRAAEFRAGLTPY